MATHEREISQAVELCRPDGRTLNPGACGWARRPDLTANLRGGWGRTKRWDYWCVLAGDLVVAVTYADVDYLGLATIWWCDLPSGRTGGRDLALPLARGLALPDAPGTAPLVYDGRRTQLRLEDDEGGTTITAAWREAGQPAELELRIDQPAGHESLNVVIPWSDRQFQYTSKHQARPASGRLVVGDQERAIEGGWGVLDVGRGRWPYRTNWNWGGGAGRAGSGAVVGLQLGGKWTVGTGFTENGVIVDGHLTKIGAELAWDYSWSDPLQPWRVRHPDGSLDLELVPTYDRHTKVTAVVMGMEVHQVFGRWSGHVTDDAGRRHDLADLQGFAEESRSRW
jgi:hypothetical protein